MSSSIKIEFITFCDQKISIVKDFEGITLIVNDTGIDKVKEYETRVYLNSTDLNELIINLAKMKEISK